MTASGMDPDRPLPEWRPERGEERDPDRISVLLEQLRSLWDRYPTQGLGQLLVNVTGVAQNPLFYYEDHRLSAKILEVEESRLSGAQMPQPPQWLLRGEAPPDDVA